MPIANGVVKPVTGMHEANQHLPEKAGVMLLDCLESRGVVVDLGVPEGVAERVAAGGAGPASV